MATKCPNCETKLPIFWRQSERYTCNCGATLRGTNLGIIVTLLCIGPLIAVYQRVNDSFSAFTGILLLGLAGAVIGGIASTLFGRAHLLWPRVSLENSDET